MEAGTLLVEVGALVFLLSFVARLAATLGISPIPLYVITGLALGEGGALPLITAEEFLEVGAEIGVILLLLMLGVEYAGAELVQGLRTSARVAALDFACNFGAGVAVAVAVGMSAPAALVVGGVTYASSSGVVAKLIDDLGWMGNRETPGVLALLVSEDLIMAVYLPILGVLLIGASAGRATVQLAVALTAVGTALVLAIRFGTLLSRWLFTRFTEAMLLGAFGLALLVAGAAAMIQVSAAVGAFIVGIAISGPAQELSRELLRPLRDLFAALFFTFFSLTVDPRDIPPVLLTAVVLVVVTAATKYAVVVWGAATQGLGPPARRRAGLLMLARGEFSIIIAELGIAAGLDERIGPLAVTYVLLLAVGAPLLLRLQTPPHPALSLS
ncbi:MAG TPA: cation:proton antiporter [Nitriliruptorales bacterium]|nr:cation:proton antiporter [Nitriliruptorales bacterium]